MKRYKKILVPVDGSDLSHDAFEQAVSLADLVKGTVTVLHVIEHLYSDFTILEGQDMISASTLIKEGPVAHEIIDLSKNYDLIIMGTHGRRMITSLFMGSVAEKVSRHAFCPVMLVRESTDGD